MKYPCYETWSETVSQIPSPAGNLTGWRAPLLQRCRAGRRRWHPAGVQHRRLPSFQRQWCNMRGFLKYGNIGNPKSWHLVISLGFPNGFLVVLVKPMGKPGSFRNTDWWHQIAVRCSHEVPDDCPGGPVIHLGGAPWRSFDLEPVPQWPSARDIWFMSQWYRIYRDD